MSIAFIAQTDSSIMMSDNQANYYVNEHLEANNLRKDTSRYLKVINDYRIISEKDSVQKNFLQSSYENQDKKIQKLTSTNKRLKKLAIIQLGAFIISTSWVVILWHLK